LFPLARGIGASNIVIGPTPQNGAPEIIIGGNSFNDFGGDDFWQVVRYNAVTTNSFPHESTSDQFFSESQFESYRMLGAHTMEKLCADCDGDFREFVEKIFTEHLRTPKPKWLEELFAAEDRGQRSRTSRPWLPWRWPLRRKKAEGKSKMFLP
jgi:hypothetical protein